MVTLVNRAKVTTLTIGTGTLTLGPAVDGFQSFAAAGVADGDVVRYVVEEGDAWEIGTGTYAYAGPSLTRSPSESSAGGAPIALSGSAVVFITATTADIVQPGDTITKLANDAGYTDNPGTVTSVAASAGAGISISGSPVTSAGTLTITNTAPHQATNLGITGTGDSRTLTSSTGSNVIIPVATTSIAGLMATGDKSKLDGIAAGAQVNVATNLSYSTAASTGAVNSSTGSNATLPAATTSAAGLLTSADKTKLDGIAAGAQVNVGTDLGITGTGNSRSITSSTGGNVTVPVATASNAGLMATGDKSKLDGIAAGAQVNVGTNLAMGGSGNSRTISSSTGTDVTMPVVSTSNAGFMATTDKSKLDGIAAGAQVNVGTNLSVTAGTTAGPAINSSTGSNVTLPTASASASGIITTGAQTFAGAKTFNSAVDHLGPVRALISAISATTIDCALANYFTKTISANTTFTFTNAPASRAFMFTLELTHNGGSVTWPTSVRWPGDTAPTLTTGKTHLFVFVTDDSGNRWRGAALADYTH